MWAFRTRMTLNRTTSVTTSEFYKTWIHELSMCRYRYQIVDTLTWYYRYGECFHRVTLLDRGIGCFDTGRNGTVVTRMCSLEWGHLFHLKWHEVNFVSQFKEKNDKNQRSAESNPSRWLHNWCQQPLHQQELAAMTVIFNIFYVERYLNHNRKITVKISA